MVSQVLILLLFCQTIFRHKHPTNFKNKLAVYYKSYFPSFLGRQLCRRIAIAKVNTGAYVVSHNSKNRYKVSVSYRNFAVRYLQYNTVPYLPRYGRMQRQACTGIQNPAGRSTGTSNTMIAIQKTRVSTSPSPDTMPCKLLDCHHRW
jgi:hypothetical protein